MVRRPKPKTLRGHSLIASKPATSISSLESEAQPQDKTQANAYVAFDHDTNGQRRKGQTLRTTADPSEKPPHQFRWKN